MFQTKLTNGVTVCYDAEVNGRLVLRYPDGSQVRTTWSQLGMMETVVQNLRELYEYLLLRAGGEEDDAGLTVEKLVQLDDLLYALSAADRAGGEVEATAAMRNAASRPSRLSPERGLPSSGRRL